MKNYLRIFVFVLLGLILGLNGYSQTGFSVHAGPSIIFRDYKFETSSLKESGINLELQYQSEISENLDFHIELDYLYNNYKLTHISMNPYYGGILRLPVREFIPLSKVPLTIGFSLNSAFYEESEFFVSGAFGGALLLYPSFSYIESNEVHTTKDEIASKMCLKLKTGIVVDETYTLSLNYFVLFGGHSNTLDNFEYNDTPTFSLTIGYSFN